MLFILIESQSLAMAMCKLMEFARHLTIIFIVNIANNQFLMLLLKIKYINNGIFYEKEPKYGNNNHLTNNPISL